MKLPEKTSTFWTLIIALLVGVGVTYAEPSIEALQALGTLVSLEKDPYLYLLLNPPYDGVLVTFVGLGVGIGSVFGFVKMARNYSLKPIIFAIVVPTLALSCYLTWGQPKLRGLVDLSWDCGAITTGPVTVPIVLSLGIGIAGNTLAFVNLRVVAPGNCF